MTSNLLKLNTNKTELMVEASKERRLEIFSCTWTAALAPHPWKNPTWVSSLIPHSFQSHIKSITKLAFHHLKNISRLRPSLLNLWLRPSSMHSSPPTWTTVMESCPGFLPKSWTGSSMCRTLGPHPHQALATHHPHSHLPSLAPS